LAAGAPVAGSDGGVGGLAERGVGMFEARVCSGDRGVCNSECESDAVRSGGCYANAATIHTHDVDASGVKALANPADVYLDCASLYERHFRPILRKYVVSKIGLDGLMTEQGLPGAAVVMPLMLVAAGALALRRTR
jgi:hypothetical protein